MHYGRPEFDLVNKRIIWFDVIDFVPTANFATNCYVLDVRESIITRFLDTETRITVRVEPDHGFIPLTWSLKLKNSTVKF